MQKYGDYNRRLLPSNTTLFVTCLVITVVMCVCSRIVIVPITQSCRDELNTRAFLMRTAKHDFVNFKIN